MHSIIFAFPCPTAPVSHATSHPYQKLSKDEIRLAKMWHEEDGMAPSEIAQLLRRDKSTMTRCDPGAGFSMR